MEWDPEILWLIVSRTAHMILAPCNNLERLKTDSDPKFTETRRIFTYTRPFRRHSQVKENREYKLDISFQISTNGLIKDFLNNV